MIITILISGGVGLFLGWKAKKKQVEVKENLRLTGRF